MKTKMILVVAAFMTVWGAYSCKKDNNNNGSSAQMNLRLTDDPGNYDAVYIDIQQIEFKQEGQNSITLYPGRRGPYNILSFRNGLDTLLVNASVPPGKIEQIRLILGSNNYVVDGGVTYPLNTPSAQESGVKLNLHTTMDPNVSYDIWLDFDAGKSIVKTGNGSYKLKPAIRAYSVVTNGRIEGYVAPLNAFATVYAVIGTDTSVAIPSRTDGHFVIGGLSEGGYKLIVVPAVPVYASASINVNVSFGLVANVGTITLLP